jgi:hypothetical protein
MRSLANMALQRSPGQPANSRRSKLRSPAPLPSPEVYEAEYDYWPWGQVISLVASWVIEHVPPHAVVFDYMCGTGYLLAQIVDHRPDLRVEGCDIHGPFVTFAERKYPRVRVHHEDALQIEMTIDPNVVLCTAGLHHLNFDEQVHFIDKLYNEVVVGTKLVFAEEAIGDYEDEQSRRIAALNFDSALIAHGLKQQWPDGLVEGAIQLLHNDVMLRGEYKRSRSAWQDIIEHRFRILSTDMIWASPVGGGDYVFVCEKL